MENCFYDVLAYSRKTKKALICNAPYTDGAAVLRISYKGLSCQVSLSMNNLAALFRKMGKHLEAEELYRKALIIREDALGQDNPQVLAIHGVYLSMNGWLNLISSLFSCQVPSCCPHMVL